MLASSGIVISLHAYLGSFSRFIADDFCSYYYAKELGVIGSAIYWYRTWHGGYSVSFMDTLLVPIGPYRIQFIPATILVIWIAATTTTIHFWRRDGRQARDILSSVSFGMVTVSLTLLVSPDVAQSLYWWGGMRAYVIPIIVFTSYLAIFQWFKGKHFNSLQILFWCFFSFCVIFASGGFSETFTPVQLVFFLVVIGAGLLFRKVRVNDPEFFFLLAGYFGALASLIAMVRAPGNAARQALYPQVGSLPAMFSIAFSGFIDYLVDIARIPDEIFGVFGGVIGFAWAGYLENSNNAGKPWKIPAIFVSGLIFAFLCFLPAAYGIGSKPFGRTLIIPGAMLVASLLVTGFLGGKWLLSKIQNRRLVHLFFFLAATILLGWSAYLQSRDMYNSRQTFLEYARKWDEVDTDIIRAKQAGEEVVYIPSMENWANLDRPTDNPKFWVTACYTQFYGIQVLGPAWEW